MEAAARARLGILRAHIASVTADDGRQLTLGRVREVASLLAAQSLLSEAHLADGCSTALRQEARQVIEEWLAAMLPLTSRSTQALHTRCLGAVLLGVTAASCEAPQLLLHYSTWMNTLAELFKQLRDIASSALPAATDAAQQRQQQTLVAAAAAGLPLVCTALAQMLSRLGDYTEAGGVKRDLSPHTSRLGGLLPSLLHQPALSGGSVALPALNLLHTMLSVLPTSLRSHVTALEDALVALIAGRVAEGGAVGAGLTSTTQQLVPGSVRVAAAACLACLPRAAGDAVGHSDLFRRTLLSLTEALDVAFMGLEDAGVVARSKEDLALGTDAGGAHQSDPSGAPGGAAANGTGSSKQGKEGGGRGTQARGPPPATLIPAALMPSRAGGAGDVRRALDIAATLLVCVEHLLTVPFPTPVSIPCLPLLWGLTRVLKFSEAAVLASGRTPGSTSGFLHLQSTLPSLQEAALGLLGLMVSAAGAPGAGAQAGAGRLVGEWLRRLRIAGPSALVTMPASVRRALYSVTAGLCKARVGGLGVARAVALDAIGGACMELYGWAPQTGGPSTQRAGGVPAAAPNGTGFLSTAGGPTSAGAKGKQSGGSAGGGFIPIASPGGPPSKKARLQEAADAADAAASAAAVAAAAAGPAGILAHRGGAGRGYLTGAVTGAVHNTEQMEACTAALGLLEVLAQVAGPLLPDTSRAALDAVAYHIAACAAAAAERVAHEPLHVSAAAAAGVVALQAASLRALAATLLAPTSTRPPFFSQAVLLFSQGRTSPSPEVAAVCLAATAQLEGLVHPRSLPITGVVREYAGLSDVQPLPCPRMWSALDGPPLAALLGKQQAGGGGSGPADGRVQEPGPGQPLQQQPAFVAPAAPHADQPSIAQIQQQLQQMHQQVLQLQQLHQQSLAMTGTTPQQQAVPLPPGQAGVATQQPRQPPAPTLLPASKVTPPSSQAPASILGSAATGQATNGGQAMVIDTQAATPVQAAEQQQVKVQQSSQAATLTQPKPPVHHPTLAADSSSDSEGSLPDIDIGDDGSDDDEDDG